MKETNQYCVISAVGKNSLHKGWIADRNRQNFDLHLIVYDDSYENYLVDTIYICKMKGQKLKSVYNYLQSHPEYIDKYDYFFIPDDDIQMDTYTVCKLFSIMRTFDLKIAQPALKQSYYSWEHTLHCHFSKIRYTNYVEMMVPCFSKEVLKKVLFTFNENDSGWGADFHWHSLIDSNTHDMAIIDEVSVVHTRPIQSCSQKHLSDMNEYISKYGLNTDVCEYGTVLDDTKTMFLTNRDLYNKKLNELLRCNTSNNFEGISIGLNGLFGYGNYYIELSNITNNKDYYDQGIKILYSASNYIGNVCKDLSFLTGITGCCWLIEYIAAKNVLNISYLEDLLNKIDTNLFRLIDNYLEQLSVANLSGVLKYLNLKNSIKYDEICNLHFCKVLERVKTEISDRDKLNETNYLDIQYALEVMCDNNTITDMSQLMLYIDDGSCLSLHKSYLLLLSTMIDSTACRETEYIVEKLKKYLFSIKTYTLDDIVYLKKIFYLLNDDFYRNHATYILRNFKFEPNNILEMQKMAYLLYPNYPK